MIKSFERFYFRFDSWYASSKILRDEIHFMDFKTRITIIFNIVFCCKIILKSEFRYDRITRFTGFGPLWIFWFPGGPIHPRLLLVNTFETNARSTKNSFSYFVAKRPSLFCMFQNVSNGSHRATTRLWWVSISSLIKQISDNIMSIIQSFLNRFVFFYNTVLIK